MPISTFIERPRTFCALGGALLTATALPEVVPILHTSMGCGASVCFNQSGGAGGLGAGQYGGLAVPSSNVGEQDIVFGGDERLREQVENTIKLIDGQLYIILTGCMTDIIGDDIQAVVRDFQAHGKQIIGAETGGFKGDGYKGYDLLLQSLFRNYVDQKKEKCPGKVNLWGIVPGQDVFWRGNLSILHSLLSKLGLEVRTFFTDNDTLDDLKNAGDAQLNIVASMHYGIEAATVFEDIHDTPFISTQFPIGPGATDEFLGVIGDRLDLNRESVEKVIKEEKQRYYSFIDRVADSYNDLDLQRYAVVVGDINYAPALTRFLADDLGWLPELTVVTDDITEDQTCAIDGYLAKLSSGYKTRLIFETDAGEIRTHFSEVWPRYAGQRYYDAFSPAVVIGSHFEREFATDIGAAHLSVSYPVCNRVILNRGYAGYEGSLSLIEDLLSAVLAQR